jgi:hypothetical protein
MRRRKTLWAGACATVCLMAMTGPGVAADAARCSGTVTSEKVGSLYVPANKSCTIKSTVVKGDIVLQHGASLRMTFSQVTGGIASAGNDTSIDVGFSAIGTGISTTLGKSLNIVRSDINGAVKATLVSGKTTIAYSRIDGDVNVEEGEQQNRIVHNVVGGDLTVNYVTVSSGNSAIIINNSVSGALTCLYNKPAPVAKNNSADEGLLGQCAE